MEERPRTDYFEGISEISNRHDLDLESTGGDNEDIQNATDKQSQRLYDEAAAQEPVLEAPDAVAQIDDEAEATEAQQATDDVGVSDYHHQEDFEKKSAHKVDPGDDVTNEPQADEVEEPPATRKMKVESPRRRNDYGVRRMQKFSLYETAQRYYLVGADSQDKQFRMLNIDRTCSPGKINIVEDEIVYTKREMNDLLKVIDHGNRAAGGMKLKGNNWGVLGFIRFTECYYMLIITKKQQVALIGGQYIFKVDGTELVPLTIGSSSIFERSKSAEELRYITIFNNLDLNTSFYFSYSYNVTRTLQQNVIQGRVKLAKGDTSQSRDINDMFVWNHHLLSPAVKHLKNTYDWCLPIIHGSIDQSSVDCFGRQIWVTLIARRSRFFAGARFLKRGANDLGYVANDVETEQIVAEMATTSLHAPGPRPLENPNYTSFVQHRGSIPLYWTQDNSGVTPKPDIDLNIIDPFYSSAALHFDHLFERYGTPITVLNLVKARERTPREGKLLVEFQNAINYLNQSLPEGKKILYRAYDMARAAKTRGQDVIGTLESIARDMVQSTGFFHNGRASEEILLQNGICRSNCIDCLDRTNAAQFVVGKVAFAMQLQALGVIADDSINYDSDAANLFAHMYNDHGDTLATQYGGSHLVNTTDSYRKINNWQSNSRDMLESFKRYYHNSFLDNQRQEAYNLFLGNYIHTQGQPMLWDLSSDYYLHHGLPSAHSSKKRRNYIHWYTPEFLKDRKMPPLPDDDSEQATKRAQTGKEWWPEYYRTPLSSFLKVFAYRINSTTRYLPKTDPTKYNMSPFCVRKTAYNDTDTADAKPKENLVKDANYREITPLSATAPHHKSTKRIASLQQWLHGVANETTDDKTKDRRLSLSHPNGSADPAFTPGDKALRNQWTLRQFHVNSLRPSVTEDEASEYERYITHPLRLPLVVSNEAPSLDNAGLEYLDYLESTNMYDEYGAADPLELEDWLEVQEDPLTVGEEDYDKKRYQAYGKWLRGKSLFKQSKVDPEFREHGG